MAKRFLRRSDSLTALRLRNKLHRFRYGGNLYEFRLGALREFRARILGNDDAFEAEFRGFVDALL